MYSQYKIMAELAKKVGGPYSLCTVLIKRTRQILRGKSHAFGQSGEDPLQEALDEFTQDALSITTGGEMPSEEGEAKSQP